MSYLQGNIYQNARDERPKLHTDFSYLPTTCNSVCAVRVENDGASAVTSHEKLPDSPNPTLRITTWLAFDIDNWKNKQNKDERKLNYLSNGNKTLGGTQKGYIKSERMMKSWTILVNGSHSAYMIYDMHAHRVF